MVPTRQQELILDHNGNAVIIAAPGSGKTLVISEKIRATLKNCPDHKGVIAISYTNKSSNELKDRCLKNGFNSKSSFFGTIDKFYIGEIIIPFGKHIWGLPSEDFQIIQVNDLDDEDKTILSWINRDITLSKIQIEQVDVLGAYFSKGIIPLEAVGVLANYVFNESQACLKYLKAKYLSIYIDEYQDAGTNQHELFERIVTNGITGVAVGDLNQSIYKFSGKSSKYLASLKKTDGFKSFVLDQNHRCHPSIINYSSYLLDPEVALINTNEKRVLFCRITGNEVKIAEWLDEHIPKLINTEVKPNHVAILTRGNRTAEIINSNLKIPHRFIQTTDLDMNLNVWSGIFSKLLRFALDASFRFIEVIEEHISFEKLNINARRQLVEFRKKIKVAFQVNPPDLNGTVALFVSIAELLAPRSKSRESVALLTNILHTASQLQAYAPNNENEVNIMTLHKSKGLEFDVVFHLDLYEWVFPTKGPGPNDDWNNPEFSDWTQDLNLHYVGITRAKKCCVLVSSTSRTNEARQTKTGKDSDFLWQNGIEKLR